MYSYQFLKSINDKSIWKRQRIDFFFS
jgi:hypothetical protein